MIHYLRDRIRRALGYTWQPLTDQQINGTACTWCGCDFTPDTPRRRDTDSSRRGVYQCDPSCILTTVDDTADLFRAKVPDACLWFLGINDVQWDENGIYPPDQARLDAEPRRVVTITHGGGALTTRPMPASHAEQIVDQAIRLHLTATAAPHPVEAAR